MKELLQNLRSIQNELKAPKNNRNTFGNYNYRSAEDILEAVKPLLLTYKLTITISDKIVNLGDRYYIEATVTVYNDIDSISTTGIAREAEIKKGMDEAQITGSASSYARKYALNGMFAIDDTKDPDTDEHHNQTNQKDSEKKRPETDTTTSGADQEILARAKAKVNKELEAHDYTRADQKKTFITMVLEKPTVDSLNDCDAIMDALNDEN